MAFPYTPNPNNIRRFLELIQSAGVPSKLTQTYLESVGFRSKNDRYLVSVLKQIRFADDTGVPTDRWRQFRDKTRGPVTLAQCLKECYGSLFEAYPDAHLRDPETIHNFMSANTDAAEVTVDRMVATFRAMAAMASFDATVDAAIVSHTPNASSGTSTPTSAAIPAMEEGTEQFVSDGILIRIKPTPDNVRRAIKFLRIYLDENGPVV